MAPPVSDPVDRHPSAPAYLLVWLALVLLATLTLLVSRTGGLPVALAIALVKAALVCAFFMHLRGGRPIHRVVFVIAMGFIVLLVLGILADVGTRSLASAYVP